MEIIELCLPHGADTSNLAVLRGLRVFRLFRLLKLLKLDALLSRLEEALEVNLRNRAGAQTSPRDSRCACNMEPRLLESELLLSQLVCVSV